MGCCKTTCTWAQNLKVGPEYRQYTVQLNRQRGFCEEYRIYVNGQEMEEHGLKYNPCSPLCCAGGQFEWEQDGHAFLLMFNSFSGGFRLFIDGVDVDTGREFSVFWRRTGLRVVFMGLGLLLIGIGLALILHFTLHWKVHSRAYTLVLIGVFYIIRGLIPIIRYWKPRYIRPQTVENALSNAAWFFTRQCCHRECESWLFRTETSGPCTIS